MFKVGDLVKYKLYSRGIEGSIESKSALPDGTTYSYVRSNGTLHVFYDSELELIPPASGLAAWFPVPIKLCPNLFPNSIQATPQIPELTKGDQLVNIYFDDKGQLQMRKGHNCPVVSNTGWSGTVKLNLEKKCECGSSSVNSPFHSSWCPLHESK